MTASSDELGTAATASHDKPAQDASSNKAPASSLNSDTANHAAFNTGISTDNSTTPPPGSDGFDGTFVSLSKLILTLVLGALLGAYITTTLLESEYKRIASERRSIHSAAMYHLKNEHHACQTTLDAEQTNNDETMTAALNEVTKSYQMQMRNIKLEFDGKERDYFKRMERHVNETSEAYRLSNSALEQASSRVRSLKQELSQTSDQLSTVRSKHEEASRELELLEKARAHTEKNYVETLQLKNAAEDELELRDKERLECDNLHRELLTCNNSVVEQGNKFERMSDQYVSCRNTVVASEGKVAECEQEKEILYGQRQEDGKEKVRLAEQVAFVMEERKSLSERVEELERLQMQFLGKEESVGLESLRKIKELENVVRALERERDEWRGRVDGMIEKVKFRSQKQVLEQFGPGPHLGEITIQFPNEPTHQTILIELAPLHTMPHSIHTFLTILQKEFYVGGAFILAREHILVGGPIDAHDAENNRELEELMYKEGYFPNGALLFREYSEEFPHLPFTFGFNSVGGPVFYINLADNTELHGPKVEEIPIGEVGEDGQRSERGVMRRLVEGDSCFAKVVRGVEVIERIKTMDLDNEAVYIAGTRVVTSDEVNR